jgi:anti-anti-sigma factor
MTPDQSAPGAEPPRPVLHIDLHDDHPHRAVIHLRGELDRTTAPALASCLDRLLDLETHSTSLIIDMTETSFIDLGGLDLLLGCRVPRDRSARALSSPARPRTIQTMPRLPVSVGPPGGARPRRTWVGRGGHEGFLETSRCGGAWVASG